MGARKRFGEVCLGLGFATRDQVIKGLKVQKELQAGGIEPPMLGEILITEGFITPEQRDQALEAAGEIPHDFIPGYDIVEKIGRGARGIVYKATQVSMDRLVALKILPRTVAQDTKYTEKFTREAKSVAKLNHPNIISGIDVGEHEGCHFFVMEYVDGISLQDELRSGPLPPERALDIAEQVAEALGHAHSQGIVHRDIKPDNIMVTRDGVAKLCDYGLAHVVDLTGGSERLKHVEGTPEYISPEQAKGLPDVDIRSDIYGLGATLYHLLTGEPPFGTGDPMEVMKRHVSETPAPLKDKVPGVRAALQKVVDRLLEKDRDKRYQTPQELLDDLGGLSARSRRAAPSTAGSPLPPSWGAAKRKQLLVAGLAGPAFALALAAVLFLTQGPSGGSSTDGGGNPRVVRSTNGGVRPGNGGSGGSSVGAASTDTGAGTGDATADVGADLSPEERAAQDEWERILGLAADAGNSPKRTKEVIDALETFLNLHPQSPLATQAQSSLNTQQLAYDTLVRREFEDVEKDVSATYEAGNFKEAAEKAKAFQGKYDHPMYSLRASSLARDVDQENENALKKADTEAQPLVKEGKLRDAMVIYEKLEDRSTPSIAGRCREKITELETLLGKREGEENLARFIEALEGLVAANEFATAVETADGILEAHPEGRIHDEIGRRRAIYDHMGRAFAALKQNLEAARGSNLKIPHVLGDRLEGQILLVDPVTLALRFKEAGQPEERTLELVEIDGEPFVEWVKGRTPSAEDALHGLIFFVEKGHYPAARALFTVAQDAGTRVPDWAARKMETLAAAHRETMAGLLLARARERMAAAQWSAASDLFGRVWDEYGETKAVQGQAKQIRTEYRTCLVEIAVKDGPAAVLKGEVEEGRDGTYEFTYDFSEEDQIEDWVADTALVATSSVKHRRRAMEVLGKVGHKVRFLDDIEVEFTAESRAIKNPNINILLNDGKDRAYLFGLGFKPSSEWVTVQVDRGENRPPMRVVLPGNVILGWQLPQPLGPQLPPIADILRGAGHWGDMKPLIECQKKYKVKVSHIEDMLQFAAAPRELVKMRETEENDSGGRVAFVPFGATLRVYKVVIVGKPDPDWLKEEIGRIVDKRLASKGS